MKLLLDEDVPVQVLVCLRQILPTHEIVHVDELSWKGKGDLALLADAATRQFDAIITNDRQQFASADECKAIRDSRLHHIRYSQDTNRGKEGLALAMASILAAAVPCVAELETAQQQRIVRLASIGPHTAQQRYQLIDPVTDPPSAYWPRSGASPRRPRRST